MQSKKELPPLPTAYRAVAILPLFGDDVDTEVLAETEQAFEDAIDALPGYRSISPRDVTADLPDATSSIDACDRDTPCLAQLGRLARAHRLLEVRLTPVGGLTTLQARALDTALHQELARVEEPLAATRQDRAEQIRGIVVQLLTPANYVGSLTLHGGSAGAGVFLDGMAIGCLPLPTQLRVPAGVHTLRVARVGHTYVHRFIDVRFGRANTVTLHATDDAFSFDSVLDTSLAKPAAQVVAKAAEKALPPHFPSWRTWAAVSSAGLGLLSLGAGSYLAAQVHTLNMQQSKDALSLNHLQAGDPAALPLLSMLAAARERGPRLQRNEWIFLGTGAALASVGAALLAWDSLRMASFTKGVPTATTDLRRLAQPPITFTILPAIIPYGVGIRLCLAR